MFFFVFLGMLIVLLVLLCGLVLIVILLFVGGVFCVLMIMFFIDVLIDLVFVDL